MWLEDAEQAVRGLGDLESIVKALHGVLLHGLAVGIGEGEPAAEEVGGAVRRVRPHQAGAVGVDLAPDVDFVGDQDGEAAGEGLGDGDAEVLLVGGEDEGVGGVERAPLEVARQHAGPGDAVGDAEALGLGLE